MNMEFKRKLPTPQAIRDMYPVSPELARQKQANDRAVRDVLTGEDDRLMLLIGPCSADREDAVLDYVTRLRGLQEKVKDKILLVPRVYSNKPRTTGDGYKGMLHQPDPNGDPDILKGLIATRKMHIKVLEQTGSTRKTACTCRTFSPTSLSARVPSRTSSTVSSPAGSTSPSA